MEKKNMDFLTTAKTSAPKTSRSVVIRNKNAGSNYEYNVRDQYRKLGFLFLTTSRGESKKRDGQKIDLMNIDEWKNGRFPYNVQCKNSQNHIEYHDIFFGFTKTVIPKRLGTKVLKQVEGMPRIPGIINVIHHKFVSNNMQVTRKKNGELEVVNKEGKFLPLANYVILLEEDWYTIVAERLELQNLRNERITRDSSSEATGNIQNGHTRLS